MSRAFPARGLYAITDSGLLTGDRLPIAVAAAIDGGARVIQYRDKGPGQARRLVEARLLTELCHERGVPLLINDDVELALAAHADGVHLGRDDMTLGEARTRLGAAAIIGQSCYASLEKALQAQQGGADYVAFGRFFPSRSKPGATPASPDILAQAGQRLHIPVVAIGGIRPENGASLIEAGADLLAVIDALFGAPDPAIAAGQFAPLFS